jgi:hypothetical protein
LGSANWIIKFGDKKVGLMVSPNSFVGDYRYPKPMEKNELKNCDLLVIGSIVSPYRETYNSQLERIV